MTLVVTAWRVALLHTPWLHIPVNQLLTVGMMEMVDEFDTNSGARRVRSRQVASGEVAIATRAEEQVLERLKGGSVVGYSGGTRSDVRLSYGETSACDEKSRSEKHSACSQRWRGEK